MRGAPGGEREIASLFWLGGFLPWAVVTMPVFRAGCWQVVKTFFHPKVVGPVIVLAGWTAGLAALGHTVGL